MPLFFENCNQCDLVGNNNSCLEFSDDNFFQVCLMSCSDENQIILLVWALVLLIGALVVIPSVFCVDSDRINYQYRYIPNINK